MHLTTAWLFKRWVTYYSLAAALPSWYIILNIFFWLLKRIKFILFLEWIIHNLIQYFLLYQWNFRWLLIYIYFTLIILGFFILLSIWIVVTELLTFEIFLWLIASPWILFTHQWILRPLWYQILRLLILTLNFLLGFNLIFKSLY
jgi:hypothetical protein